MKVTDNVYVLECTTGSHVYLVKAEVNILIDTGWPGLSGKILAELQSLGIAPDSISNILLTHHDADHVGNAKQLQDATGAKVWASEEDIPYIIGERNRPGLRRLQTLWKVQKPAVSGCYAANQRFVRARGHTPGHTIFQFRDVLSVGDLFRVPKGHLQLCVMNCNPDELKKSIALIKGFDFTWLCPAHGEPIQDGPTVQDFLSHY